MVERFEQLTDKQVLALTDAEVKRWIDIECAVSGVPLLPPEPEPIPAIDFEPDVTAYNVGDLYFDNAADASKVLALLQSLKVYYAEYVSAPGYKRMLRPKPSLSIDTSQMFSVARWDTIKAEAAAALRLETAYNTAKREYDKVVEKRKAVVLRVTAAVEDVHAREQMRVRIRHDYERYLDLADGDTAVALRFLRDAWRHESERVNELFPDPSDAFVDGFLSDLPDPRD